MGLALLLGSHLPPLPLLVSQIMSHLGPKHPFVQPLAQLLHDPSRTGQIFRSLVALHQLFDDCRIYPRLFAFLALRFLLLLLGHFHLLLPQVVTHTQILGHPRVMLLLLSKQANSSSPQIRREVERAVNRSIIIIPVRLEDVMPARSLEFFLSTS